MDELSRGLLDTSVLIAQLDDPQVGRALPKEVSISVATLAELHFGVLVARDEITRRQRLQRLGSVEAIFQPIPIDPPVARAFAAIAHAVKISGRQPRSRVMDLWIAATALAHRLTLFTRNPSDFMGLEELIEVRVG
ncbi:MAG: type II toxin-antitoxin system VapC family toxin [Acidobacteriota bacterium]